MLTAFSSPGSSRPTSPVSTRCTRGRSSTTRRPSRSCRSPTSRSRPRSSRSSRSRREPDPKASAVLVQGQFFSDDTPTPKAPGTSACSRESIWTSALERDRPGRAALRRHRRGRVARAGLVSFVVDLPGEDAANVARVLVAFRDGTSSTWRFLDLRRGPGANWGGTAPAARRSSTSCRPSTRRATSRSPRTRASCSQPLRRRRRAGRASSRRSPGQRSPAGSSSRRSWTSKRWRASLCRCRLTTARSRPSQAR